MLRATTIVRKPAVRSEGIVDTVTLDHAGRSQGHAHLTAEGGLSEVSNLLTQLQSLVSATANSGGLSKEEKDANQLQVDSILNTINRIAQSTAFQGKKLHGVCFCTIAIYGNASTRLAENVPSSGTYAYGGWPDVDELYRKQLTETDPEKRGAMLAEIQKILHERVRFAPIYDYFWASGIGPRVVDPALMKIDPFPGAAPLEEVKLKRP